MELNIRYKKSQESLPLLIGAGLVSCGIAGSFFGSGNYPLLGTSGIGIVWLVMGWVRLKSGYLKISGTKLVRCDVFPTRVLISDITGIKKFADDWMIKYQRDRELTIQMDLVRPDQKELLEHYLLNLQTQYTAVAP